MKSTAALLFTAALMSPAAADYYHVNFSDAPPVLFVQPWSGWYFGSNAGYGWGRFGGSLDTLSTSSAFASAKILGGGSSGLLGGGQAGYSFQQGAWVYGIETDVQAADISGTGRYGVALGGNPISGAAGETIDWFGTARVRFGYLPSSGPALIYFTGGLAYGDIKESATLADGLRTQNFARNGLEIGTALGGGLEYLFGLSWSLKAEYLYVDFGGQHWSSQLNILGTSYHATGRQQDTGFQTFRAAINYHVNNPYQPLK